MSDLISRSELKKSLKSNCDVCNDKNTNWCEHCCPQNDFEDLIDNAPTVKYPFYQEAYQTGYEEGKNEILKGKCENCDLYFKAMTKEEMKKGGAE